MFGFLIFALGAKLGVHRNEGCREHAFPKQIAEQVWDTESGAKSAGYRGVPEEKGDGAFASEAREAGGKDSEGYARRATERRSRPIGTTTGTFLQNGKSIWFRLHWLSLYTADGAVRDADAKLQIVILLFESNRRRGRNSLGSISGKLLASTVP